MKLNKPVENPYDVIPGSCSIVADGKEYTLGFCTYFADFVDDDPTVIDITCLTLDYYRYADAVEFEFGGAIKNIEYLNLLNIEINNNECYPIEILNFVLDNIPADRIPKISSDTIEIRSLGKLDWSNLYCIRCGLKETALQKYNLFLKQKIKERND